MPSSKIWKVGDIFMSRLLLKLLWLTSGVGSRNCKRRQNWVLSTHANEGHFENIRRSKSTSVDYWCSLSSSKENLVSTNAHSTDRSAVQHVIRIWGRLCWNSLRNWAGNTNLRDGSRCSNFILMAIMMLPSVSDGSRLGRKGVLF